MATYPLRLLTVLVFQLTLFVEGQESENLFHIEDDSQKVEKRLIDFIHYKNQQEGPVQILWKKIRKKNVCNRSQKFRKELCKRIMNYEFYGFEESDSRVLSMKRTFTLRSHTLEPDLCRITMFWCPPVEYLNLETGEKENFPIFYNISRAERHNALFVYIQREKLTEDPIYPLHYLYNIHLRRIKKLTKKKRGKSVPPAPTVQMNANCQQESVIRNALEYAGAIKIEYPYQKFAKLYASVNVCSMKRTHKIHACRLALKHNFQNIELDTAGYKFPSCRRHSFHFADEDRHVEAQSRGTINALPCPPLLYKSILPARFIVSPILHFISSTLQPDSVLYYSRLNKYGHDLQLKCHFDRMQVTQLFVDDRRRSKLLFYPYPVDGARPTVFFDEEHYFTQNVSFVDSARGSVKTPSTIENEHAIDEANTEIAVQTDEESSSGDDEFHPDEHDENVAVSVRPIRVIFSRWFAEYAVISLRKVRQEKLVYQKFMQTYSSIDICHLTHRQKNELCNEFIKEDGFTPDKSPSDDAIDYPCIRQKITLSRREAEELGDQAFPMWQCPPCHDRRGQPHTFYAGKSHLKDAAIVYKLTHFEGIDFVHPELFVSHVNRYTLADAISLAEFHRRNQEPKAEGSSRGTGGIKGPPVYRGSFLSRGSDLSEESVPLKEFSIGR